MSRRTLNSPLLKQLLRGRNRVEVAYKAKVSTSLIDKVASEKAEYIPKERTQLQLCKALGVDQDELFPPQKQGEGEAS